MAYPKSPQELAHLYQHAQGMIVYHKTAAAVEAMLCGCPVLYCSSRGLQRETVFYPGFDDFAKVWDFDQAAFFAAQDSIAAFSTLYDAQEVSDRQQLQQTVAALLDFFKSKAVPAIALQPQVLLAQARQYEALADYVQAAQCYRKSLLLAPERLETRFYFGRMLAEIGLWQAASAVLAPGQNEWHKLPQDPALTTVRAGYHRLMAHVMAKSDLVPAARPRYEGSRSAEPEYAESNSARIVQ
jgi:tetratricopeptide (TPR) repeat protein